MKRIVTSLLAASMLASPLAISTASAQDYGRHRGDNDRRDNDWNNDRGRDHGRYDRRDRRDDRRDHRRHERWSRQSHNGYYLGSRWYYGPPPASYYDRSDYRPDYRAWRRGDRIPAYYRSSYRDVDYRYYHLRQPPRGYHYVRDDRGDILLAAIATGIILSVIANN